jgi:asparagine synthetase B (glutamine-hydrolysing)
MLCQVTGKPAPAYSIGFDAEGYDEMEYARLAAKHFGCEHHEYYVTPADLVTSIPAVAQHYDQPFGNSSALPAYYCARNAQADGCTKMLAGDGGDELFGGNSRYAMQRVFEFYHRVPPGLRRLIEPMCADNSPLRRIPGLKQATGYVRHSRVPMPDRLQSFNLITQLDPANVLTADFLAQIDIGEPSRHMQATWNECPAPSLINRMLAYDWRYTLADSDLPKVRGATQMAGIPVAYPLLSDRLTDFSMALPARLETSPLQAALVLQGSVARLPARRDHQEEEKGLRTALRRLDDPHARIETTCRGFTEHPRETGNRSPRLHPETDERTSARTPGLLRRDGVDPDHVRAMAARPGNAATFDPTMMECKSLAKARMGARLASLSLGSACRANRLFFRVARKPSRAAEQFALEA